MPAGDGHPEPRARRGGYDGGLPPRVGAAGGGAARVLGRSPAPTFYRGGFEVRSLICVIGRSDSLTGWLTAVPSIMHVYEKVMVVRGVDPADAGSYLKECEEGERGFLVTRGRNLMAGYVQGEEATRKYVRTLGVLGRGVCTCGGATKVNPTQRLPSTHPKPPTTTGPSTARLAGGTPTWGTSASASATPTTARGTSTGSRARPTSSSAGAPTTRTTRSARSSRASSRRATAWGPRRRPWRWWGSG